MAKRSAVEKAIVLIGKNTDENKAYKKLLQKHLKYEREYDPRVFHWEIGQLIYAATEDAKAEGKHYGEDFVERFGVALGYETGSVLRTAARVYERWPEERDGSFNKEFKRLLSMKNVANRGLSWTHISHLYWEKDPGSLKEMAQECLDRCLTATELHRHIQKQRKTGRANVGGRPHSIPRDAADCMTTMMSQFDAMFKSWENGWFSADFDLLAVIKTEPVSEALRDKIEDMVSGMEKLVTKFNFVSPKFDKVVESMTKELNGELVKNIRATDAQKSERKKRLQKRRYAAKTVKV